MPKKSLSISRKIIEGDVEKRLSFACAIALEDLESRGVLKGGAIYPRDYAGAHREPFVVLKVNERIDPLPCDGIEVVVAANGLLFITDKTYRDANSFIVVDWSKHKAVRNGDRPYLKAPTTKVDICPRDEKEWWFQVIEGTGINGAGTVASSVYDWPIDRLLGYSRFGSSKISGIIRRNGHLIIDTRSVSKKMTSAHSPSPMSDAQAAEMSRMLPIAIAALQLPIEIRSIRLAKFEDRNS